MHEGSFSLKFEFLIFIRAVSQEEITIAEAIVVLPYISYCPTLECSEFPWGFRASAYQRMEHNRVDSVDVNGRFVRL